MWRTPITLPSHKNKLCRDKDETSPFSRGATLALLSLTGLHFLLLSCVVHMGGGRILARVLTAASADLEV